VPRPSTSVDTAERILQVAEQLVQARGYNAFSYADIARTLNLTKASLHYHFPTTISASG
jgi:TetR/AcrR family transcriptional repressor of nem operon